MSIADRNRPLLATCDAVVVGGAQGHTEVKWAYIVELHMWAADVFSPEAYDADSMFRLIANRSDVEERCWMLYAGCWMLVLCWCVCGVCVVCCVCAVCSVQCAVCT
jgi:hypothetical protein